MVRAIIVSLLVLVAATVPSEAAKRTVHLFKEPFVFNFARDYKFIERVDPDSGKRDAVLFASNNKSIAIMASVYDPANTSKLMSRDAFVAKMKADKATDIIYVNDETPDGRLGSHLLGACTPKNCLYRMQSVVGQKIWLSVVVTCDDCSKADVSEVGALADKLYKQLRTF